MRSARGDCALDDHPERRAIDQQLLEGVPYRLIQDAFLQREPPDRRVTPNRLSAHRAHTGLAPTPRYLQTPPERDRPRVPKGETTLEDLRSALADLKAGRITHDEALAVMWRDERRLYRRPAFKTMRARRIADACAQCGTSDGPLVLQHTQQPLAFRYALPNARSDAYRAWRQEHPAPRYDDLPTISTEVCPRCDRKSFYRRMYMDPPYRCTPDGHEFTTPALRVEPDPALAGERYAAYRAEFEAAYGAIYKREAVLAVLRSCIAYLEGANVVTLCKKCAYMADVNGMVRCAICNQHWHDCRYATCYSCAQAAAPDPIQSEART